MRHRLLAAATIALLLGGGCGDSPDGVDSNLSTKAAGTVPTRPDAELAAAIAEVLQQAEAGDVLAQFQLGYAYFQGEGVEQDHIEAAHWFDLAAHQDHAGAQYLLGYMYYQGLGLEKDDVQAVHWVRQAAEQGQLEGEYLMGYLYYKGHGTERDYVLAHFWLSRARDNGFAKAIETLELCESEMTDSQLEQARIQSPSP
jgi:TPR repeat protein